MHVLLILFSENFLSPCAVMCGSKNRAQISAFAHMSALLSLSNGAHRHDTYILEKVVATLQVSAAARDPGRTWIANPPASWLDDFLSWLSPGLPHCCREDSQGKQCPPPDQFPCNVSATACDDCATCFTTGSGPHPHLLPHNRPTLEQVRTSQQVFGYNFAATANPDSFCLARLTIQTSCPCIYTPITSGCIERCPCFASMESGTLGLFVLSDRASLSCLQPLPSTQMPAVGTREAAMVSEGCPFCRVCQGRCWRLQ